MLDALARFHDVTVTDVDRKRGELPESADLLLVELNAEGGDDLLRYLGARRPACMVVLDRGASQQQVAEAFRLGAQDCLSPELDASLAAERVTHLCRRILTDRSHAAPEGVR